MPHAIWSSGNSTRFRFFFHNFRGYDAHLLVWGLAQERAGKVNVIAQGMERYLLLEWCDHLQFKDSLQFLQASLASLVESLKSNDEDKFYKLKSEFSEWSKENYELLKQKGIYPYDWMDDMEKLKETCLPLKTAFDSLLRNERCSDEDYIRAIRVWERFECQTFKDYHELYLKCIEFILFT